MAYTVNIAQNPGLQLGLTGYAAINNATIEESSIGSGGSLFGNPGLLVTTPGNLVGEGVITPVSAVAGHTGSTFTFSVYIQGITEGDITVYAVSNPGGAILGSVPVSLTIGAYQRAVINNLTVSSGASLYLIVSTTATQATNFWITNVQIEPDATAHPYCDGGQPGCTWEASVGGVSSQAFQNIITASANNINASNIVNVLILNEAFNISSAAFNHNNSQLVSGVFDTGPVGAMTDFGVYSLNDPDPAQTYVSWNTAGLSVPTSGYSRNYGVFVPPQDYFVSGGQQLYKRAAFMASGWQFSSVPNTGSVILAKVVTETRAIDNNFGVTPPSPYVLPRAIESIIKPNRLNYCPNPGIEVSTQSWSAVGSATLTQDSTVFVNTIVNIDDQLTPTSTASLKASISTPGDGAQIIIPQLIVGDQYIVSAYVQAGSNISDIFLTCANGATDVVNGNAGTGYGTGGYGAGNYGGNPPIGVQSFYGSGNYGSGIYGTSGASTPSLATGQWFRIFTTFTANADSVTLTITATPTSATTFWIDNVLVEPGQVLGDYFDGGFGNDYFWDAGGLAGLTRSYLYDEQAVKQQAVINVFNHHLPVGISYLAPLYFTPPLQ